MSAPELHPHPGPPAPPASAAGVGLRPGACLRYRVPAGTGTVRMPLAVALPDRAIEADDELVWEFYPRFDDDAADIRDGFRAASVAVDLRFDDGRRLLTTQIVETDGVASAAASRADLDFPDQWNQRRIPLTAGAGARIGEVELVIDPPPARGEVGAALEGWIAGVRLETARQLAASASPSERVTTTRGSHSSPERSRGLTQPATGVPHGGIQLAPATRLDNPHWTYSWNAHGSGPLPVLQGLLISRSPSIWIGDRGALAIRLGLAGGENLPAATFDHDAEQARPHRYRLQTREGIGIDAAATDHAARIDVTFPAAGRIALCAPGTPLEIIEVRERGPGALEIFAASTLASPHEADPLRSFHALTVRGGRLQARELEGGLSLQADAGTVAIAAGSSQISLETARHAAAAVVDLAVNDLARSAQERWDAVLSAVEVAGTDEQRALVASDLYRLFLFPSRHDEDTAAGPRYPSPTHRAGADSATRTGRVVREGRMLTNNGFWDTYRTAWPAYALLAPHRAVQLLDGMLEHVRDGGWSPRWTAGTALDAMVGTSLDIIAADLVSAGLPGIDLATAYAAALRNATCASSDPRFGRRELTESLRRGWVSAATTESVSWTLEGAIADAGAAVLARASARADPAQAERYRAEARYLAHRALTYASLWDPETEFFRPRTADGRWADEPFDPRVWGGGHTETNAWGQRFSAPHDGAGLARLFGGPSGLGEALDASFAEAETGRACFAGSYGTVIHEMVEARDIRRGMWAPSNQPAHHVPWMYAHSDRPWRVDDVLTDAATRLFRGIRIGQGYPGDEDNGEMSAWHLFTTLGLAPYQPGSGMMLLTAPQVPEARLRPIGGEALVVRATRRSASDRYIRSVRRDGRPWTRPEVSLSDLRAGGEWELELGSEPVRWAEPPPSRPFFAPDGVDEIALRDLVESPVELGSLGPGHRRRIPVAEVGGCADDPLLVVGLRDAGSYSFRVLVDGDLVRTFVDEQWPWPQQARPFAVPVPPGTRQIEIDWGPRPATLTLVQLLAAPRD